MSGPLQIIKTNGEDADCFVLMEENLNSIISKIPTGMKVSVVAVVGAFRTGKSFLLNFFLRYLRYSNSKDLSQAWMVAEGEELTEGNCNMSEGWNIVDSENKDIRETSFAWRGGEQRQTTGIWMWSEPFIRPTSSSNGEDIAILLMDTQGMFDNETTMKLTSQIFGLSTLVSSFQVYNVDKRIQEDNLQHLALFSEYGRMALLPQIEKKSTSSVPSSSIPDSSSENLGEADFKAGEENANAETIKPNSEESSEEIAQDEKKPFQRLQFLVRDWQNFDREYEEGDSDEIFANTREEMLRYLNEVLKTRASSDLQSTREQILRCFEKLDCFLLPHPGSSVTKKNYDGSIKKIDEGFRALINRYVRLIFDSELAAKTVNHRQITGPELKTYFEVYTRIFQSGDSFPKAMTMLDATTEANNRNAHDLALLHYKIGMDKLVGVDTPFVKESELIKKSNDFHTRAEEIFTEIATMGADSIIAKAREGLIKTLEEEKTRYMTTNALRNPFKGIEFYILPLVVALSSWVLAFLTDITCSTDFCEKVEDTFVSIYLFIFVMIVVLTWKQIRGGLLYLREMFPEATEKVDSLLGVATGGNKTGTTKQKTS